MAKKLRTPQVVTFLCESCRAQFSPDYVRERNGVCGHCQGESWTICIVFVERKVNLPGTFLGTIVGLFTGIGWHTSSEKTLSMILPAVTSNDAMTICQVRFREPRRVLEYLKYLDKVDVEAREEEPVDVDGAKCFQCDARFVRVKGKPWSDDGFCSRYCYSQGFVEYLKQQPDEEN
jgi:hypothetical protein